MDTNSLAVSLPRELAEIVNDVAIIDVVHEAHERVREVMRDGFEDAVLHNQSGITPRFSRAERRHSSYVAERALRSALSRRRLQAIVGLRLAKRLS